MTAVLNQKDLLFIVGAGGHAKVVSDIVRCQGASVAFFIEDDEAKWGQQVLGIPVLGGLEALRAAIGKQPGLKGVVAVGNNAARERWQNILEGEHIPLATCIHPSAQIGSGVVIGAGTVVVAGAVINADARLGRGVIVNTAASVDHDCDVGDFVHLAPGTRLCGTVTIGTGSLIGAGACVVPGRTIGDRCTIGAGSVVTRDIPADITAFGTPCKATGLRKDT